MTRLVESGRVRSQKKTKSRTRTPTKKAAGAIARDDAADATKSSPSARKATGKRARPARWVPGSTEGLIRRVEELRQLPTMTVEEAAMVLGISRASAYNAVKAGEIKVKVLRGRKLVLSRALFAELGYPV